MAKKKKEEDLEAFKSATGVLPANDKKFSDVVGTLIKTFGVSHPQEVMLVNRLVATWMKILRVEELMGKYDLFFEQRNPDGEVTKIEVNQLAYYLSKLEADFRGYYRTLQGRVKSGGKKEEGIGDLIDLMKGDK